MRNWNNSFDNTSHTIQKKTDKNGRNIRYLQYSKEEYEKLLEFAKVYKDFDQIKNIKYTTNYISSVPYFKPISYSGLLAIVHQLRYCKDIIIEAEKITIDFDISSYQSFMYLRPQTSTLRLRIKEIDFQYDDSFINLPVYKVIEITDFEPCDRAALLIFRFLVFTNLVWTLEELIFLSGLEINLDLLDLIIVIWTNRKINLQFYDYRIEKSSTNIKLVK